jgi:hypothetical protein
MRITYCERWLHATHRPFRILSDQAAKRRYDRRLSLTAVIGDPAMPASVLEIAPPLVTVGFLDHSLREVLAYTFEEVEPGRLFLKTALWRDFEAQSDEPAHGVLTRFTQDGSIEVEKHDLRAGTVAKSTSEGHSTAANWEAVPAFGSYSSICRKERDVPVSTPVQ